MIQNPIRSVFMKQDKKKYNKHRFCSVFSLYLDWFEYEHPNQQQGKIYISTLFNYLICYSTFIFRIHVIFNHICHAARVPSLKSRRLIFFET